MGHLVKFVSVVDRFQFLLEQRSSMAQLCHWTSILVDTYTKVNNDSVGLSNRIRRFLVVWNALSAKILRQLKMLRPGNSAASE